MSHRGPWLFRYGAAGQVFAGRGKIRFNRSVQAVSQGAVVQIGVDLLDVQEDDHDGAHLSHRPGSRGFAPGARPNHHDRSARSGDHSGFPHNGSARERADRTDHAGPAAEQTSTPLLPRKGPQGPHHATQQADHNRLASSAVSGSLSMVVVVLKGPTPNSWSGLRETQHIMVVFSAFSWSVR